MNASKLLTRAVCGLLLGLAACQLVKTEDSENAVGRGSTAFDPYAASASGAIKLGLQMFNGCAILANGQLVAKGNSPVPDYPTECDDPHATDFTHSPKVVPQARFLLMTDTTYFLNQISLIDQVVNLHKNASDLSVPTRWMRRESRFKGLDWHNLGVRDVHWGATHHVVGAWSRETTFHNANWMLRKDDTFKLEVIDHDGTVKQTIEYSHGDFLGESSAAGHTHVAYKVENILAPRHPGDEEIRGPMGAMSGMSSGILYRTLVRYELAGSTNPFKNFRVLGVSGDGAIRLTWSQLPDSPFYFPVTFVRPQDVPPTCFKEDGSPTPCGFGVEPRMTLSRPKNGQFYEPGETFDMYLDIRDGDGNRLHSPTQLSSYADFFAGKTNGLLYAWPGHFAALNERDITSSYQVVGPVQDLKTWSDVAPPRPFFSAGRDFCISIVGEMAAMPLFSGMYNSPWPTRYPLTLPPDVKPGTYAVVVRAGRQFMGERVSKGNVYFFQVGQREVTRYPSNVGNCQMCHRGVISLDNLRHGFSVDHVETCKACHMSSLDYPYPGRFQEQIHRLHMTSTKYKADKTDCRMCHLTRESAVRPSLATCQSCHPSTHGNEFFSMEFTNSGPASRFSNCAQACHVLKTPSQHILPE